MLEDIAPDLDKGHLVYVEGKIKTLAFTNDQGIKRYKPEVISNIFKVLSNVAPPCSYQTYLVYTFTFQQTAGSIINTLLYYKCCRVEFQDLFF